MPDNFGFLDEMFQIKEEPIQMDLKKENTIQQIFNIGTPVLKMSDDRWSRKKKSPIIIKQSTLVGVELEVEGIVTPIALPNMWESKQDGSLRNYGIEYVTYPTPAKYIPTALENLFIGLSKVNSPLFSDRTSTHVHINVLDMTMEQVKTFLILYLSIENLLYEYAGEKRKKSIFCVPISHAGYVKTLQDFVNSKDVINFKRAIRNWHKYAGCNLLTILTYGTIEFRHLYGTDNVESISNWIKMLLSLKDAAMLMPLNTAFDNISILNTSSEYEQYLVSLLGENRYYLSHVDIQEKMEKDVTHIKTILIPPESVNVGVEFENSMMYKIYKISKQPPFQRYTKSELKELSVKELKALLKKTEARYIASVSPHERIELSNYYSEIAYIIAHKGE